MKYTNPEIESSYQENDLGKTLYDLVLAHKPTRCIEIGTLYGYSAVAIAMALDELGEGHLTVYDLFEDYAYKHGTMEEVQKNLERYGVEKYVTLVKGDFEEWITHPESFDFLHVDVSNKGHTIDRLYGAVKDQMANGAEVVIEGSSPERDQVEWMTKYNETPIGNTSVPYEVIDARFPSISRLLPPA